MKDKKTDSLLSRREFFKKTAKTVLPMMAFIAIPSIITSCDKVDDLIGGCKDCADSCDSSCSTSCSSGCKGGCGVNCSALCKSSCTTKCTSAARLR
ncbi:MAG: hypothetical protein HDS95_04915 [Bacteroidales bacterium]|nr:hypothetical protein [Bacteroidales bacterium]